MEKQRKYPLGVQTFSKLREEGYMYVDKTEYIYKMTHANTQYVFLSRPRRFGKSLLTSTLRCYFEGRKELFKGLAIEGLEKEWEEYPVLHFDMSTGKHLDKEALERNLISQLVDNEERLGIQGEGSDINTRFRQLIARASEKTGMKVVILIDEYDSPLLDVMHEDEELPVLRKVMTNFYSPLKASDPYIRFCFLTGITKFSQLSIFSALNNIANISMEPEYAAICGISKEELLTQMSEDIDALAVRLNQGRDKTVDALVEYYDGYHFTWPSPDIFNPYSLINAFSSGNLGAYWFETATPTFLIEMLRKSCRGPVKVEATRRKATDFDAPTERLGRDIVPLLYQSGYITIKDYSRLSGTYLLDIPNKEVRVGLTESLLGEYVEIPAEVNTLGGDMAERIYYGDMDGALSLLQQALGTLPYCTGANSEGHFQQLLAMTFILTTTGYVDVEVRTPRGRVDVVLRSPDKLYLIEIKMNKSAEIAMKQIDLKDYPSRFALCGLPVVKVGINFDGQKRNISDWEIESA